MAVYPERRKGRLTGKWIAEVVRNGERIARKTFALKRDADSWEGSLRLGESSPVELDQHKGPTFGEAVKALKAAHPMTRDPSGRLRLEKLVEEIGDGTPVVDVTTRKLDKLVEKLREKKRKPGTINRYLSAVSSVFTFTKDRWKGEGIETPAIPWQDDDGHRLDFLTEQKEAEVVDYMLAQGWLRSAFLVKLLTETGMRWGELESLTPEQIEPATGWIRLWKTKNTNARSVPVSRATAEELLKLKLAGELPDYRQFRDNLKRASKHAGLPASFSIHALRHTTATRLIQKGVNLRIVQRYLGHKTIVTTTKYAHVQDDDLQSALEKISPRAGQEHLYSYSGPEKVEPNQCGRGGMVDARDLKSPR